MATNNSEGLNLGVVIQDSFNVFGRKFATFLSLAVLFSLITLAIDYAALYFGWTAIDEFKGKDLSVAFLFTGTALFALLYNLVSWLVTLIFTLANVRVSAMVLKEQPVGLGTSLSYGFFNLWQGFSLALRSIWYVFWRSIIPIAIVLILFALVNTMMASNVGGGFLSEVSVAEFISAPDTEPILAEADGGMGSSLMLFRIANFALMAAGIFSVLWAIYVGMRVIFGFYAMAADNLEPRDALLTSVDLVKNNFWKVLGYTIVSGILFALLYFVAAFLVVLISGAVGVIGVENANEQLTMADFQGLALIHMFFIYLVAFLTGAISNAFFSSFYLRLNRK